jgi:CTP synthase (UTP-ammonia lyase)
MSAMERQISIGIIGDFDPARRSHLATNDAIGHAADCLDTRVEVCWLPTDSLLGPAAGLRLEQLDALWAAPGSPYRSMEGALAAIRFAREQDWPFVGT